MDSIYQNGYTILFRQKKLFSDLIFYLDYFCTVTLDFYTAQTGLVNLTAIDLFGSGGRAWEKLSGFFYFY